VRFADPQARCVHVGSLTGHGAYGTEVPLTRAGEISLRAKRPAPGIV